jgi:hypothetical protein
MPTSSTASWSARGENAMPLAACFGPGRYVHLRSTRDHTVMRTLKSATSTTDSPSGLHLR